MTFALIGLVVAAWGWALFATLRLYRWERQLRGARVVVAFKGRVKMTPTLYEWLTWALILERDKSASGRAIYKMGGTTIAILKPHDKSHGKAKTTTIKEAA